MLAHNYGTKRHFAKTGYPYVTNTPYNIYDTLHSILAPFECQKIVRSWDAHGAPFCRYMYVPEEHSIVNTSFDEQEDNCHVFKENLKWL